MEEIICNIYSDLGIKLYKNLPIPRCDTHPHLTHAQWCFHEVKIMYTSPVETEKGIYIAYLQKGGMSI